MADTVKERFEAEMRGLLQERISIGAIVAACVYPCYLYQDFRMAPDRWHELTILRLSCSLFCILSSAVSKTVVGERHPFPLVLLVVAVLCTVKTWITTLQVAGLDALYFGGHVLLIVGALSLLPVSWWQAVLLALAGQLGYAIPMALVATKLDPLGFYIQNTLMATVSILLILGCHLNYEMRFREFRLRGRLHNARLRASDYG